MNNNALVGRDAMPVLRGETESHFLQHAVSRMRALPRDALVDRKVASAALDVHPGTLANWDSQEKRHKLTRKTLRAIRLRNSPKAPVRYRVGDILDIIDGTRET